MTKTLYKCAECGWSIHDKYFFTEVDGEFYCSLHKERNV
jgi:DNA-directed RNA polymerase subunit RPC12/RpoP